MIKSSTPLVKTHVDIIHLVHQTRTEKVTGDSSAYFLSFVDKMKTLFQTASSLCSSLWKSLVLPLRLLCVSSLIQKL